MKTTPDQQSRKHLINLTSNEDLAHQAHIQALEQNISTWNDFGDKIGSFADEHSTL